MSTVTTTVNVNPDQCTATAGTYQIVVHYTATDAGSTFGPFSTKEVAEKCLLVVANRSDIKSASLEVVS